RNGDSVNTDRLVLHGQFVGEGFRMRAWVLGCLLASALMLSAGTTTAVGAASSVGAQAKVFRPVGFGPSPAGPLSAAASSANLLYNGGSVFTAPKAFAIYWGPQWSSGFSTGGFSSAQA